MINISDLQSQTPGPLDTRTPPPFKIQTCNKFVNVTYTRELHGMVVARLDVDKEPGVDVFAFDRWFHGQMHNPDYNRV